ncbi:MAG: hypothetical protein ACYSX0_17935 [Planctomycetota bacterium]|jgi:hypothetical protein
MTGAVLIGLSILLPMLGVNFANMKGWVSVVGHVLVGFFLYLRPRIQKEADAAWGENGSVQRDGSSSDRPALDHGQRSRAVGTWVRSPWRGGREVEGAGLERSQEAGAAVDPGRPIRFGRTRARGASRGRVSTPEIGARRRRGG